MQVRLINCNDSVVLEIKKKCFITFTKTIPFFYHNPRIPLILAEFLTNQPRTMVVHYMLLL